MKMRRIVIPLCIFFTLILALGWSANRIVDEKVSENQMCSLTEEHFGTYMTITLYGRDSEKIEKIIEKAFDEVERLEMIFSPTISDSEICRVNLGVLGENIYLSDELYYVIKQSVYYNELSEGAFDISIGKLIDEWGIGTENEKIPDTDIINRYRALDGLSYVVIDDDDKTIHYESNLVSLNLGGIAKGYAGDRIKEFICKEDETLYGILDFGGNIVTIGQKEGKQDFVIGVTNPFSISQIYSTVTGSNICVVTSGNYERYFEKEGVRYHHLLDPYTGYPADNGVVSATVIGTSSLVCDALSTSLFVLGVDKGLDLIHKIDGYEAILIDRDGMCHESDGISQYKE